MKYYFNRFYRWLLVLGLWIVLEVLAATYLHHGLPAHRGSGMPLTAIPSRNDGKGSRDMEKDSSVVLSAGKPAQPVSPEDENGLNIKAVTMIVL